LNINVDTLLLRGVVVLYWPLQLWLWFIAIRKLDVGVLEQSKHGVEVAPRSIHFPQP
jgi:hypothetical protein